MQELPLSNKMHKEVQVEIKPEQESKEAQANIKPLGKRKGANCILRLYVFYNSTIGIQVEIITAILVMLGYSVIFWKAAYHHSCYHLLLSI